MKQHIQTERQLVNTEINQSFNTSASSVESKLRNTILDEYANLRCQKSVIEAKLKEIESIAVDEALNIIGEGLAANGKQKIYSSPLCDITLQFRTIKVEDSEHQDLEHLAEMIEIESEKACHQNKEAIASLKQQITALEAELEELMNTPQGNDYRAEYEELRMQLSTKKPILAVKLK